jgi:pimeloyl-ACP methyl ester carboxylesterase
MGGSGRAKINKAGRVKSKNFLVRSRNLFVKHGFAAIVPDAPSDNNDSDGMKGWFRETKEHTTDLKALLKLARDRFHVPVWLVGTSRGTNSVANGGTKILKGGANGLVFTASMSEANNGGPHVMDFDLKKVRVPVLISHHKKDECWVTPFSGAAEIKNDLINAPVIKILAYDGGASEDEDCSPHAYHGFNGIEDKVVSDMTKWMLAHQ